MNNITLTLEEYNKLNINYNLIKEKGFVLNIDNGIFIFEKKGVFNLMEKLIKEFEQSKQIDLEEIEDIKKYNKEVHNQQLFYLSRKKKKFFKEYQDEMNQLPYHYQLDHPEDFVPDYIDVVNELIETEETLEKYQEMSFLQKLLLLIGIEPK